MKLDVYTGHELVGTLEQVDLASYVFTYRAGVSDDLSVSLLMPPSVKPVWESRFLHPVFQVSLPEGMLRQVLTRAYAKRFASFGETELLACIGSHLIGRNKVAPHGEALANNSATETLPALLQESTDEMLEHFLQVHATQSGVSGGFRKFLAKSPTGDPNDQANPHATLAFDHWIVKANDDDHPGLVFNEFYSMRVAKAMGLPVPEFHVAPDFSRLVVRRFDIDDQEHESGFEDMCALNAFNADQKFSGSVERIVKALQAFCAPDELKTSLGQFYAQYVACMALRNGDAHLKNFGVLYTTRKDVKIAPVYDMVTMSAYAPRAQSGDALDEPALSLNGVRRWLDTKALQYLAARCGITAGVKDRVHSQLCDAVTTVATDMVVALSEVSEKDTLESVAPMAKRMLELWSHGMRLHNTDLAADLAQKAESIEAVNLAPKRERMRY